jgi:hypothetical protein
MMGNAGCGNCCKRRPCVGSCHSRNGQRGRVAAKRTSGTTRCRAATLLQCIQAVSHHGHQQNRLSQTRLPMPHLHWQNVHMLEDTEVARSTWLVRREDGYMHKGCVGEVMEVFAFSRRADVLCRAASSSRCRAYFARKHERNPGKPIACTEPLARF